MDNEKKIYTLFCTIEFDCEVEIEATSEDEALEILRSKENYINVTTINMNYVEPNRFVTVANYE